MTELFAEIVAWAVRAGADRIDRLDAPWEGETDDWKVRINGTRAEIDNVPPMSAALEHKTHLAFCVVGPGGGAVTGAREADLIDHFKAAHWQ